MSLLTFAQCKDQVARSKHYPNWETMENFIIDHNTLTVVVAQLLVAAMQDAGELFAAQNNQGVINNSSYNNNEFSLFGHWRNDENTDDHSGTIKHFQD